MFYYGHYGYEQDWYTPAALPTPAYRYFTTGYDDWLGEELHYDWQITKSVHLLAGADGRQSLYTHQHDYETPGGDVVDVPASVNYWGIFTEGEYKPIDWLSLTIGARMDHEQRIGTNASPRFAAIVTPTKMTPSSSYMAGHSEFHALRTVILRPGSNDPNPNLHPEVVDTFEIVWERQFHEGWRTSLGGYVWKMKDAMENHIVPDGALETLNGPTEWALAWKPKSTANSATAAAPRAYATFTRAEHDGNGLLDSPEWILGAAVVWPVYKNKTFLSIEPQIVGQMKTDLGFNTQPTYLTNIVLTSRDIVPGWNLQAGVYNLFANNARLPRDGPFNQFQPTLNYPDTSFLVSISHRF